MSVDLSAVSPPSNFRARFGSEVVTGDVFNIAERLDELSFKEFGERGLLILTDRVGWGWPEDGGFRWVVSEISKDGQQRWVMGVKNGDLDARIISKCEEALHTPFEKRFKQAEAEEARRNAAAESLELDRMAEEVGLPMLRDLERCGFIQRRTSYSKRGTMGPRRMNGRVILP